jgi:hypothetical protein
VLGLGLLGLPLLWRRDRLLAAALLAAFAAQTYANGAIYTWHLSGAFGFRRLIECTPLFVLGLAVLLDGTQRLSRNRPPAAIAALLVALALVGWNAGLVFNWAVGPHAKEVRRGLDWRYLPGWQLDVPRQAASKLGPLLFDRCKLYQNQGCGD